MSAVFSVICLLICPQWRPLSTLTFTPHHYNTLQSQRSINRFHQHSLFLKKWFLWTSGCMWDSEEICHTCTWKLEGLYFLVLVLPKKITIKNKNQNEELWWMWYQYCRGQSKGKLQKWDWGLAAGGCPGIGEIPTKKQVNLLLCQSNIK